MTQKNGCTTTPLPAQALEVKALYFTKGAGDKYLSVYAQYGSDPAWVPLQITIPATPDLQQVRDMDRNIAIDSGSYEDAHMYLRSADGNNMTAAFFTNAAGGGIQVGNAAGLAPLHLQADGGLLTYGGDEVATKTWVDQQPAPGLQATTDAGNDTSHELMIKGVRFGVGKTGGNENVAVGRNALENASAGANYNVALGSGSMEGAVSASNSTAVGEITLAGNATGSCNSAFGNSAMYGNTSGDNNTAVGMAAGLTNHPRGRGNFNLFMGRSAGQVEDMGTSTMGDYNIMIGYRAGKDSYGDSQLRIGNKNEVTGEHIIEGDMAAKNLVLNSTLAVTGMTPYTSGGYQYIVWNNTTKRYETIVPDFVGPADDPLIAKYRGSYEGKDANTLSQGGWYDNGAGTPSGTNFPVLGAGFLKVTPYRDSAFSAVEQEFIPAVDFQGHLGRKWYRTSWNGVFGSWKEYLFKEDNVLFYKGQIPYGSNLNDYLSTGLYHQSLNVQAASGTNYPAPYAGMLEVLNIPGFAYQTYRVYKESEAIYSRTFYNGSWSAWKQIRTSADDSTLIQQLSLSGNDLSISGGNTVTLPAGADELEPNGYGYGKSKDFEGWDTGGGLATGATMYFQNDVIEPANYPALHSFVCVDNNSLELPDAEAWKGRILQFKCISLDRSTTRTLSFTGEPLRDYNNVLSAFTYDKLSLSAAIKSSLNPATGTWEWECLSAQHNIF